jgi:phage gp46-like protein
MDDFEGDLLLRDTPDGGDIIIEDGLFKDDRMFDTAVYLSLFGGNKDDDGKVENSRTWWGNTLTGVGESEKLVSRFQALITRTPMTAKTIREAEAAAELDLQWLVKEGAADRIVVTGKSAAHARFVLHVEVSANGASVYAGTFQTTWRQGGMHGV